MELERTQQYSTVQLHKIKECKTFCIQSYTKTKTASRSRHNENCLEQSRGNLETTPVTMERIIAFER